MKPWDVITGDCVAEMAKLGTDSVDSIVTDPPYELGFMGKTWDRSGVAFRVETWEAAYRVLKPGGYLLAFGGTRTSHRMAVAIEDAGFEIRDTLLWLYGVGFPKSLNVSADQRFCSCSPVQYSHDNSELRGVRKGVQNVSEDDKTGFESDLFAAMQRETTRSGMEGSREQGPRGLDGSESEVLPIEDDRRTESGLEGRRNLLQDSRELQRDPVCSGSGMGESDGAKRRLHDGASASDGDALRSTPQSNRSRSSQGSQSGKQRAGKPGALADERQSQSNGAWPTCERCSKPVVPSGLGTALKPACEPIVLARKPFPGTVAANVLKHGTGALNIDASRIGTSKEIPFGKPSQVRGSDGWGMREPSLDSDGRNPNLGRWPANVILDESAAADLDAQSDHRRSGSGDRAPGSNRDSYSGKWNGTETEQVRHNDFGGASRFFYVAKASSAERGAGLGNLEIIYLELEQQNDVSGVAQWESADRKVRLQVDTAQLAEKVIGEFTTSLPAGSVWNTISSGSDSTALFRRICKSTISTKTSSTTKSKTLNWLTRLLTSESIPVVKSEAANGGNRVENAANGFLLLTITSDLTEFLVGADRAQLPARLRISASGESPANHPTVKPIALLTHLIRLVTPVGGTVLDPFLGSGTTAIAALRLGFRVIGIEQSEDYATLAMDRIRADAPMFNQQ